MLHIDGVRYKNCSETEPKRLETAQDQDVDLY